MDECVCFHFLCNIEEYFAAFYACVYYSTTFHSLQSGDYQDKYVSSLNHDALKSVSGNNSFRSQKQSVVVAVEI